VITVIRRQWQRRDSTLPKNSASNGYLRPHSVVSRQSSTAGASALHGGGLLRQASSEDQPAAFGRRPGTVSSALARLDSTPAEEQLQTSI